MIIDKLTTGEVLTIISILSGVIIGFMAFRQNALSKRREHTFDVMLARFTGDTTSKLHDDAFKYINEGIASPDGSKKDKSVSEALNLYEFIALAAKKDILDKAVIVDLRGGTIISLYDYFLPYIKGTRKRIGSDRVYEHLEWFVENYARDKLK